MHSIFLVLGFVLGFGASETPTRVAIDVEVEGLPDERQQTKVWLSDALQTELVGRGVEVVDGSDVELIVQLRPGPGPEQDVVIRTELREGERILVATEPEICLSCNDAQLLEIIVLALPNVVISLTTPEPAMTGEARIPVAETDAIDAIRPNPLLLGSGVGVVLAGSVGLGVGAGLLVVGERVVSDPGASLRVQRNYRPAGIALVATGAAMVVAGAVLLKLALSQQGRRSPRRISFVPWAGRDGAGALVTGRF